MEPQRAKERGRWHPDGPACRPQPAPRLKAHPQWELRGHLEDDKAPWPHKSQQLVDAREHSCSLGEMLEDKPRVDEVEGSSAEAQSWAGIDPKRAVRAIGINLDGSRDHPLGDVDPNALLETATHRSQDSAKSAAHVESALEAVSAA